MMRVWLAIFLVSLFVLRPYQLENSNLLYHMKPSDDLAYLAHATAMVLGDFPHYEQEKFVDGLMPMHSIGPGLLALPFVFLFSRLDIFFHSPILTDRSLDTVLLSWTSFGFVFATVVYFCLSCFLLFHILSQFYSRRAAALTTILLYLLQGFPLFAYRRPVFSHVYELFAQTVLLWLLVKATSPNAIATPKKAILWGSFGGSLNGLISLIRYNNVFMSLSWPLVISLWAKRQKLALKARVAFLMSFALLFALMIIGFKIIPTKIGGGEEYPVAKVIHTELASFSYLSYRFFKLIFGWDWGLVWTAPFSMIGLLQTLRHYKKFPWLLGLGAPIIVNLILILLFGSQGGWYGYRYIIFVLTPLCAFGLAELLDSPLAQKKYFGALLVLVTLPPVLSMLCFEGNPSNLTLRVISQDGRSDWGNATYQLEVWKTLVLSPLAFAQVLFKAVPAYIAVLLFSALGKFHQLPAALTDKYGAGFQVLTLIRTSILLSIPLSMAAVQKLASKYRSS